MKQTKIAIGCLVQWYEVNIIKEYLQSLREAAIQYQSDDLYIDFAISSNEDLESSTVMTNYLAEEIEASIHEILDTDNLKAKIYVKDYTTLLTIADYRRTFNEKYCNIADVLVWGESDMLVPVEMFSIIDHVHTMESLPFKKYIMTFASCKMWDGSWKPLEHPEFTDKPFIENDNKNWWSLRYTMTSEEMNNFNSKAEDITIKIFNQLKFNGCGLVISSEVIKAGVNIPQSVFFVHEDTAFMNVCKKLIPEIQQVHISNILLVHNRKHPKKRSYIRGEEDISDKSEIGKMRNIHPWYQLANKFSEINCYRLFDPTFKFYTWQDVWNSLKEEK